MVQISTLPCVIVMGLSVLLHARLSQRNPFWLGGKTIRSAAFSCPSALIALRCRSRHSVGSISSTAPISAARSKTREDAAAVALVGIDKNRVFALGWGLGAALVAPAGATAISSMSSRRRRVLCADRYVTVALGGFGSAFGAFAGGILVGLVEGPLH
jgi:branched-chain amino acid transport system permease protein